MNQKKPTPPSTGPTMAQIWVATGLAVVVILGIAMTISFMVRKNNETAPPPPVMAQADMPPGGLAEPAPAPSVPPGAPPVTYDAPAALQIGRLAGTLRVETPAAPPGQRLALDHTCYRAGQSIPVNWHGVPRGTRSLVLTVEERQDGEDPLIKWLVYDMPPTINALPAGLAQVSLLDNGARQGRNGHNTLGYTGPCVPRGQVPYILRLYALDVALDDVPAELRFEELIPHINGHIIDAAAYEFVHYLRY